MRKVLLHCGLLRATCILSAHFGLSRPINWSELVADSAAQWLFAYETSKSLVSLSMVSEAQSETGRQTDADTDMGTAPTCSRRSRACEQNRSEQNGAKQGRTGLSKAK